MTLTVKDLQQNVIGLGAEPLVIHGEVPANLTRARGVEAKWHESNPLLGVVAYLTSHKYAKAMSA
ncbi:MAG: hypothetical protein JO325_05070 [Solirubrobacterales bacterium]|nr:hypothetical protein [Solirubrobacterales bacterium]